jgi:hypothetical protein
MPQPTAQAECKWKKDKGKGGNEKNRTIDRMKDSRRDVRKGGSMGATNALRQCLRCDKRLDSSLYRGTVGKNKGVELMSRPEHSTQNDNVELVPESTAPLSTIDKLVEDNSTYNVRIDQKEGKLMTWQGPNRTDASRTKKTFYVEIVL